MSALRRGGRWQARLTGRRSDGSTFSLELSMAAFPGHSFVCLARELAPEEHDPEREAALAGRDPLTGLPGRGPFDHRPALAARA